MRKRASACGRGRPQLRRWCACFSNLQHEVQRHSEMLQECFTAPSLATSSVTTAHKKLERSVKPARKGYSWKERDGDMNSHPYLQHSRRDASSSSHAASPNTTPGGCPRDPERQPSHNQLASSSSSSTASAAGSTSGNASETQTTLGRGETSGSVSSSASSSSLQRRVSSEAQEAALVATVYNKPARFASCFDLLYAVDYCELMFLSQVHSLQQAALALREGISGGTVDTDHVQSTLNKMLQEHAHLATTVATVASSLEVVNKQSRGRAAKHIASSHNSLGSEVSALISREYYITWRNGCGLSHAALLAGTASASPRRSSAG